MNFKIWFCKYSTLNISSHKSMNQSVLLRIKIPWNSCHNSNEELWIDNTWDKDLKNSQFYGNTDIQGSKEID